MEDNIEYSRACSDVWYLLQNLNVKELSKIPQKLIETMYILKEDEYESKIDLNKPLEEQELSLATTGIIAFIYNNYLGTPEEKEEYKSKTQDYTNIVEQNKNYEIKFKDKIQTATEQNKTEIIEYQKETNLFKKIINKIKKYFKN